MNQPCLTELSRLIDEYFSLSDLHEVCFELGIPHDEFTQTKHSFIIELIPWCIRRNRLSELTDKLREKRSHVCWPCFHVDESFNIEDLVFPPLQPSWYRWLKILLIASFGIVVVSWGSSWIWNNNACSYQQGSDNEVVERLIRAEAEAANNKNITIINAIFAKDTRIENLSTGEEWNDPIGYYQGNFANVYVRDTHHFDIKSDPGSTNTDSYARYISGDSGYYTLPGQSEVYYFHEVDSPTHSIWTLQKNFLGCWEIIEFQFH